MSLSQKLKPSLYLKTKADLSASNLSKVASPSQQASATIPPSDDQIRSRQMQLAPSEPLKFYIDDPVFDTKDAARFLGVKDCRMEKWRQRDMGPEYIRYDRDGVRYQLSSLVAFMAARRVRPSKRRARRES